VERSAERAAANEATFREANERLERSAAEYVGADEAAPYLCECEEERCTHIILLTRQQYEAVRANARRFVVAPGHHGGDDRAVQEEAGFTIIDKTGREGELVEQRDPRATG
jgi:hypothetical protein